MKLLLSIFVFKFNIINLISIWCYNENKRSTHMITQLQESTKYQMVISWFNSLFNFINISHMLLIYYNINLIKIQNNSKCPD